MPSIQLFCPLLKSKGAKDIIVCLYRCPPGRLMKCEEYLRAYPELLTLEIDPKYEERYGTLNIPVPVKLRRRRPRWSPKGE